MENKAQRRKFLHNREKVTEWRRKLPNEEIHNLSCIKKCYLDDEIDEDEIGGAGSTHGGDE
jgi:hypothetical protein